MKQQRDVSYITAVIPKEKAAYIISRGENMCIATGLPFSQSSTLNMIIDYWFKQGAPALGPGDVPTPVPKFNVRLRYARRPRDESAPRPEAADLVEQEADRAAQLRNKAKPARTSV